MVFNKRQITRKKLLIEYNGEQHYKPINFGSMSNEDILERFNRQTKNDDIKKIFCKINGYNLLIISYKQFKNIENILAEELNL